MKKLLLLALSTILLFSIRQANAQTIDFQFTITNASSSDSCDGTMYIVCTGSPESLNYTWYNDTWDVVGTGSNISGLCANSFYFVTISDSHCRLYSFEGFMADSNICGSTFEMKSSLIYTNDNTLSSMQIQQVNGDTTLYYTELKLETDTGTITLYTDTLNSISNLFFDSLSFYPSAPNNLYTFYTFDSSTIFFSYNYYIGFHFNDFYDTSNSCGTYTNIIWLSAQGVPVSDSSLCNGYAYTEVYGGTPPYTYQFSSGSTNSTATGLCPGSYIVTVTDADSNVFSTTFVIGYPETYYFSDGGNYNYLDTLYSNALQDCGIDYTMPIDTFYIDSSYSANWQYIIGWVIVQDTNEFLFTETYFIDTTGYYWFGLSLYCDERSSDFGSYTFFAGAHADMSGATQVQELAKDNPISVYPNPSNGIYQLKSSSKMKEYTIYDQLGRMVAHKRLNSDNETVNISELHNGMYYFVVQFQDGSVGRQKLVKK